MAVAKFLLRHQKVNQKNNVKVTPSGVRYLCKKCKNIEEFNLDLSSHYQTGFNGKDVAHIISMLPNLKKFINKEYS